MYLNQNHEYKIKTMLKHFWKSFTIYVDILFDKNNDPTIDDNYAIRWASENGHIAIVDRLLQDGRVDPSAFNNFAIKWASNNGHIAVVDRLLQDGRVDPSAFDNFAIKLSSQNGHFAVVERLKQEARSRKIKIRQWH